MAMGAAFARPASEAAYHRTSLSPIVSFFTGWMMLLAYFIVCPGKP